LYGIAFETEGRIGWIWGNAIKEPDLPSTILRTENGGRTWTAAKISSRGEVLSLADLWFDAAGQYGWAVANVDGDPAIFRSVDSGKSWEQVGPKVADDSQSVQDHPLGHYRSLAMTPDGTSGWAVGSDFILATAHQTQAPHISRFVVTLPDFRLDLAAYHPDTPADEVEATIEVGGEGLALVADKVRRSFKLSEADSVQWPKGTLHKGEKYTFHLRLMDDWNIVTSDFELDPVAVPTSPSTSAPLELSELHGLDLGGARILLDGREVEAAQVLTRGNNGHVSLAPTGPVLNNMPDGFHALTIARGGQEVLQRIGFYKEQLSLKLFRPYTKSYALIVAIGDYPAGSGYRKLPSAIPQGRELEKTLREQGFTVLPSLYDRDATKARIEMAIRTAPAGPEDRLFVYFGGHGDDENGFQEKPVGYLIPFDGRKSDLWGTAIPLEKITGEYSSHLRAKHVLFALDSCQSGFAVSRGGALNLSAEELRRFKALVEIETLSREPGRTVLTAGTGGQDALDVSGGIFTSALTDAIRGKADADHNGVVDYFELFAYVWGRVNDEARQWTRRQQPADYQLGNGRWVFVYP
jgi:hypothetical protein